MKRRGHTRREILKAAERCFAATGYTGASINEITAATRFSKPVIYYHFGSKAGLFSALLEQAYDECFEIMEEAEARSERIEEKLVEILASLFNFFRNRKDLTRLAFAAAFAAPNELPSEPGNKSRRCRNFDFFHTLIRRGLKEGILDKSFDSRTLTYGIYGALSFYLMANVLLPGTRLDRRTAKAVVRLFLKGAAAQ